MNTSMIRQNAILVTLRMSSWSARKYDRAVTAKVVREHGATEDSGRFNKCLLPGDAESYKALIKAMGALRQIHYDQTLPFGEDGSRLLPVANQAEYQRLTDEAISEILNTLLPTFQRDYPALKEAAQRLLNGMYKEEDYPSVAEIGRRFTVAIDPSPIPEANFRKVAVASGLQEKLERQLEERVVRATTDAMRDAWQRLYTCVEHLHERLSTPGAIFRDSLVTNVEECCDILSRLNVTGDADLERMRTEAQTRLLQYSADTLRDSSRKRATVAEQANQIMTQILGTRRIVANKAA